MFEAVATVLAARAKVANALENDQKLLDRIPATMQRRRVELAKLDAQIAELKKAMDAQPTKK